MKKRVRHNAHQISGYFNPFSVYTQTTSTNIRLAEPDKKLPIVCCGSMMNRSEFWV